MAERCEQCLADGIAILPQRWGVEANNLFKEGSSINRARRLLREGYIYILDNTGGWYGYVVTQNRYLKQFDVQNTFKTPDLPISDYTCHRGDNCSALNSFIRIPNPNNDIETLWLAYSPVKWTKVVIERHQNNANGAKTNNMIKVLLADAILDSEAGSSGHWGYDTNPASPSQDGIFSSEYYSDQINIFTKDNYQPYRGLEREALRKIFADHEEKDIEVNKMANRVIEVIFDDRIGELIDLNEFLIQHEDSLEKKYSTDIKHKLDVANIINGLEHSIKSSVKESFLLNDNEKRISGLREKKLVYFSPHENFSKYDYKYDKDLELTASLKLTSGERSQIMIEAEKQANKVWTKEYEKLYRKQQMNEFLNSVTVKEIEKNFKEVATYILRAHNELIKNDSTLKDQMQYNFDTSDVVSGMSYTETVLECIGVTVNDSESIKLYADLMTKDINDQQSYLLRALVFNYQNCIDAVTTEGNKNLNWENLDFGASGIAMSNVLEASWSSLLGTRAGKHTDDILKKSKIIQQSVEQLSAPLLKVISQEASSITISQTMYAIGLHFDAPIMQLRFAGTKKQAIAGLTDVLLTQTSVNSKTSAQKYARLMMHQLKVLDGVDLNANITGTTLVLDTKEANSVFKTISNNRTPTRAAAIDRLQALETSAKSGHIGALSDLKTAQARLRRYQNAVDIASNEFVKIIEPRIAADSISNKLATGGTLVQAIACMSLAAGIYSSSTEQGLQKAMVSESGAKLIAGIGFLYGGILDQRVAIQGIKVKNPALSAATKESLTQSISKNAWWAKRLNIGAAVIFSGFDFYHAYDEAANKGNAIMSGLYFVSGVSGIGAVVAVGLKGGVILFGASISWTGIGVVLFVIAIGVGFLIARFTLSPLQEWIQNSIWGSDSLRLSHAADIAAYKAAIESIAATSDDNDQSTSSGSDTSNSSVNSTNNQKATSNSSTDIPDYQYFEADKPLDYKDIEYEPVEYSPEVKQELDMARQRLDRDNANAEPLDMNDFYKPTIDYDPVDFDDYDYQITGTSPIQQSKEAFSIDFKKGDRTELVMKQNKSLPINDQKAEEKARRLKKLRRQLDALEKNKN